MDLTQPLLPLTSRQRAVAIAIAVLCALSRLAARARSLWDWDETLFCLGMRSFDVSQHHPHPPGFPVYIGLGRIARMFIHDDFRALQSLNLLAGMLLFPAVLLLARELRLRFETALIAAALCAFLPNVWFFGGTAFSDLPSLTLVVFGAALLFRGCRDGNAYISGAVLLGLAIGIRPQNILIGLFPGLIATWHRIRVSWRDVVFGALAGTTIVVVAFGAAILATGGMAKYMGAVHAHADYISRIDSFRSSGRPPLWRIFDRFFIKQYDAPVMSVITSLSVAISVVGAIRKRDRRIGYLALTFVPFAFLAWLMLDRFSVSRFSIGYAPMFAILAADGIERAFGRRPELEWLAGAALVMAFAVWTLPALTVVRTEVSPPVLAMDAIRRNLRKDRDELFVGFAMTPYVEYFIPDQPYRRVLDERAMPLSTGKRAPWLLTEIDHSIPRGFSYHRERGPLWKIARRHYFDVALERVLIPPEFVSGWYPAERGRTDEWRWMSGRSVTRLPPLSGKAMLRLNFDVPSEVVPQHPRVTVAMNGVIVDQFSPDESTVAKDFEMQPAPNGAVNVLELAVDRTITPSKQNAGDDSRELGLLLRFLSWGPA